MKKLEVKYKEEKYEIMLDNEDYEFYKDKRLVINNARGNLFVMYSPYTSSADSTYLHKILMNTKGTNIRTRFEDGNRLNLQKKNIIIITPEMIKQSNQKWHIDNREKISCQYKKRYKTLKTERPEEYKEIVRRSIEKQKIKRKLKTQERLANCHKEQKIKKYSHILSRSDVLLLINKHNLTKNKAKSRNMEFDLTFDEYLDTVLKGCHYTGVNLLLQDHGGTSLDRIDNTKGYIKGNVLPCIGWVNKMRMDHMTVEETKLVVDTLIEVRRKK